MPSDTPQPLVAALTPRRAISSERIISNRKSATPLPPNSSGMDMPMIPDWAALRHICRSTRWSSSHCSKCGTTSRSRKAATELRKASWSSLYRFLFIGSILF